VRSRIRTPRAHTRCRGRSRRHGASQRFQATCTWSRECLLSFPVRRAMSFATVAHNPSRPGQSSSSTKSSRAREWRGDGAKEGERGGALWPRPRVPPLPCPTRPIKRLYGEGCPPHTTAASLADAAGVGRVVWLRLLTGTQRQGVRPGLSRSEPGHSGAPHLLQQRAVQKHEPGWRSQSPARGSRPSALLVEEGGSDPNQRLSHTKMVSQTAGPGSPSPNS
jgi:hypothetical protein